MKITADTTVLVRALVQDDPEQAGAASALLEQAAPLLLGFAERVGRLQPRRRGEHHLGLGSGSHGTQQGGGPQGTRYRGIEFQTLHDELHSVKGRVSAGTHPGCDRFCRIAAPSPLPETPMLNGCPNAARQGGMRRLARSGLPRGGAAP
jgi:hypothetical protein